MAAMVVANNPGSWSFIYPGLRHADWHGCTPVDLIFPAFLTIVGVAMPFALGRYQAAGRPGATVYRRVGRRVLVLFGLGLLLNGFPTYNLAHIRILGVLQRIALAYGLAALAVLHLSRRGRWLLVAVILVGYAALLLGVPDGLSPTDNPGAWLDRRLLGTAHLYQAPPFGGLGDPESLLGTLPATATVLVGVGVGDWLRSQPRSIRTSLGLALAGLGGMLLGWGWGWVLPLNKALWTSSYVLFTSGVSLVLLAGLYHWVDVQRGRPWAWPLEVMGQNAILLFVGSGLVGRLLRRVSIPHGSDSIPLNTWIYETLCRPWAGEYGGSLLYAGVTLGLWWVVLYGLYRRRWFLRV
ncbi:MAG: DUF5009 domain-containing protein [Gloeomargaritaceae cyanobacterium C42_A2020_066]|nr:DUF5009 domain-containing protein [Gloeomargaritaceae cyanobacterium C42_A2020_066]